MRNLIHRYVRRLIVWAQSPSDEEVAAREVAAQAARRARIARNVRNALLTAKMYPTFGASGAKIR